MEKATVSPEDLGAGVPSERFERLGAVHDWKVWDGGVAENKCDGTVDVADVDNRILTATDSDLCRKTILVNSR